MPHKAVCLALSSSVQRALGVMMDMFFKRTLHGQTYLNLAFLNKIVDMWNTFPFEVRSARSISIII